MRLLRSVRFVVVGSRASQDVSDDVERKPTASEKAGAAGAVGRIDRRCGIAARMHRTRPVELADPQGFGVSRRKFELMLLQFAPDAQMAEARRARMDARFDEPLDRQIAASWGIGASRVGAASQVGASSANALAANIVTARASAPNASSARAASARACGSSLRLSSTRLCSRCASH